MVARMVNAIARTIPTANLAGFGFGAMYPSWIAMPNFEGRYRERCVSYFTLRLMRNVARPMVARQKVGIGSRRCRCCFQHAVERLRFGPLLRGDGGLCPREPIVGRTNVRISRAHGIPLWLLRARRERPCCCAAEKRNELASLQLIELHSVPAAKPDGQDIELGWISQRLFGFDSSRLLADFSPSGAM